MSFFQRKNSKKVKDSEGSQKGKNSRGKNDLFDRAKGGLEALAGSLQSSKNDAETATEKLQGDVKSILHKGSGLLEKAKEGLGGHSDASRSKELEKGSEEQGKKDMDAFSAVLDKVKSNPEVAEKMEKIKDEVKSLAEVLHLRKHESKDKEPESEEKAKEGETSQNVDESASANKTEEPNVLEHAVEEIQAVIASVQQQQTDPETEIPTEAAATAETSAEGEKPEEIKREVEKDEPNKRTDFLGFFAMLFERFCSPDNKKKD